MIPSEEKGSQIFATSFWLSVAWGDGEEERGGTSLKVTIEGVLPPGTHTLGLLRGCHEGIAELICTRFDHALISPTSPDLCVFAQALAREVAPFLQSRGITLKSVTLEEEGVWIYRREFPQVI